jgi:hypothetical protein
MKRLLGVFTVLYVLVLLQTSFVLHVTPGGITPNLVIIMVLLFSIFEKPGSYSSFTAALFGGFLLDIFSPGFFIGFWALVLIGGSSMIKALLRHYVRISIS